MQKETYQLNKRIQSSSKRIGSTITQENRGSLKTCVLNQHLDIMSGQLQQFSPILKVNGDPKAFIDDDHSVNGRLRQQHIKNEAMWEELVE